MRTLCHRLEINSTLRHQNRWDGDPPGPTWVSIDFPRACDAQSARGISTVVRAGGRPPARARARARGWMDGWVERRRTRRAMTRETTRSARCIFGIARRVVRRVVARRLARASSRMIVHARDHPCARRHEWGGWTTRDRSNRAIARPVTHRRTERRRRGATRRRTRRRENSFFLPRVSHSSLARASSSRVRRPIRLNHQSSFVHLGGRPKPTRDARPTRRNWASISTRSPRASLATTTTTTTRERDASKTSRSIVDALDRRRRSRARRPALDRRRPALGRVARA